MNLNDLNGNIEIPKPWLNIVTNTCSSLFGTYMNGGFPVSFQNFSQVQRRDVGNSTLLTSLIFQPIVPPNYGDLSFPILSSGAQINVYIPFLFEKVSGNFIIGLYLNNVNIVQFPIAANAAPNTGYFKMGIAYDAPITNLTVFITGSLTNSSTVTTLSEVTYVAGDINDFDVRVQFNTASPNNRFTAFNISSETYGLFNSAA